MDSALEGRRVSSESPTALNEPGSRIGSIFLGLLLALASAGAGLYFWQHRLQPFSLSRQPELPRVVVDGGQTDVAMANGNLAGLLGVYDNQLQAYLRLEYLRGRPELGGNALFMSAGERGGKPVYRLYVLLANRMLEESTRLAKLEIRGFIPPFELASPPRVAVEDWHRQSEIFIAAYRQDTGEPLLALPREELIASVAQFMLFKARTDRRVRRQVEPAYTELLSLEQARQFATDMIDAAQFYDLPLSMLLGIGAMENNYLDVRGDLQHAVWKRRKQPGDIVIERGRHGWVRISDSSIGPWQVTRETLRRAHDLYLNDTRDYTQLPDRLQPPRQLDFEEVSTPILTTYAALWLRHLLDACDGDFEKAEGAYNGSIQEPNLHYAQGVELVAAYARRVIGAAADGQSAAAEAAALAAAPR